MFSLSRWSGGLVDRYGARIPLMVGPIIAGVGFFLFTLPSVSSNFWISFFPAIVVLGFGMAITVAPLTTTVMSSVIEERAGIASGINNAVSRTASLLAVAGFGVVMLHTFGKELDQHLMQIPVSADVMQSLEEQKVRLAGIKIPENWDGPTQTAIRRAIQNAFVSAFQLVMTIASGLALASALITWIMIGKNHGDTESQS